MEIRGRELNPTLKFNGCEKNREMFATFLAFLFQNKWITFDKYTDN